ncbi:uncharacterized protein DS421_7g220880 [Arachis hypogaea]|nr:uncharacterized protein DS421_7g220880 [Arachis hypogaea]
MALAHGSHQRCTSKATKYEIHCAGSEDVAIRPSGKPLANPLQDLKWTNASASDQHNLSNNSEQGKRRTGIREGEEVASVYWVAPPPCRRLTEEEEREAELRQRRVRTPPLSWSPSSILTAASCVSPPSRRTCHASPLPISHRHGPVELPPIQHETERETDGEEGRGGGKSRRLQSPLGPRSSPLKELLPATVVANVCTAVVREPEEMEATQRERGSRCGATSCVQVLRPPEPPPELLATFAVARKFYWSSLPLEVAVGLSSGRFGDRRYFGSTVPSSVRCYTIEFRLLYVAIRVLRLLRKWLGNKVLAAGILIVDLRSRRKGLCDAFGLWFCVLR